MAQTTKNALAASLKNLLLQKPLTKITINDITEDCGISRMTFYYHFKDIYDLVEWIGSDMSEDPAAVVERTSKVVRGNILRALDAFRAGTVLSNPGK